MDNGLFYFPTATPPTRLELGSACRLFVSPLTPSPAHFQVSLAHREAVLLEVDLDDLRTHDESLCDAVLENTKRYSAMFCDVVQELLPVYRDKQVRK